MLEVYGKVLYRKPGMVYVVFDYVDALKVLNYIGGKVFRIKGFSDNAVVIGLVVDDDTVRDEGDRVVVRIMDKLPVGEEKIELIHLPLAETVFMESYYMDIKSMMPGVLKKYNFMDMFVLGIIYNLFSRGNELEIAPFWTSVARYLQEKYPKYVEVAGKLYPLFLEELGKVDQGLSEKFDEAVRDYLRGVSSGLFRKGREHYVVYMMSPSHSIIVKTGDYADILVTLWKSLIIPDNSGYEWLKKRRGGIPAVNKGAGG